MIFNLGSINADYFYDLPSLPGPGETLAAKGVASGLGGKGANQSVAAALAGADVHHIGAVGPDGTWAVERLMNFGVNTGLVRIVDTPTAHAIVMVDQTGENQIVIFPGANMEQDRGAVSEALSLANPGDWLMLQNETSLQVEAAKLAKGAGLKVAYSAAPFDIDAVGAVMPLLTLLIMNAVEAEQLTEATGTNLEDLPVPNVLVTRGADGASWYDLQTGKETLIPAYPVDPIDTTGAGDTFAGYAVAGLSQGFSPEAALQRASAAAALCVTRKGTADAIPDLRTVEEFLNAQDTNGACVPQS